MSRGERAAHQIERPELYEHTDVAPTGVIYFLIGLGLTILLSLVFLAWYFQFQTKRRAGVEPFPLIKRSELPPAPRIQRSPELDLGAMRAHEDSVLETYGWVDQQSGIVRIPIDRAMDLLAQRGLQVRTGAATGATAPETGPESGGPQTGEPVPRYQPAQPSAATESSRPLEGAPQTAPGALAPPGPQIPTGPAVKGAAPPGTPGQPRGPGGPRPKPAQQPGTKGPATSQTGATPEKAPRSARPNPPPHAPPQ